MDNLRLATIADKMAKDLTARDTSMSSAINKTYKRSVSGLPALRRNKGYKDALLELIAAAVEVDRQAEAVWMLEYQQSAG